MQKQDERDRKITSKSGTAGFVVASVLLLAVSLYKYWKTGNLFSWTFIIFGVSQAVYWLLHIHYRRSEI